MFKNLLSPDIFANIMSFIEPVQMIKNRRISNSLNLTIRKLILVSTNNTYKLETSHKFIIFRDIDIENQEFANTYITDKNIPLESVSLVYSKCTALRQIYVPYHNAKSIVIHTNSVNSTIIINPNITTEYIRIIDLNKLDGATNIFCFNKNTSTMTIHAHMSDREILLLCPYIKKLYLIDSGWSNCMPNIRFCGNIYDVELCYNHIYSKMEECIYKPAQHYVFKKWPIKIRKIQCSYSDHPDSELCADDLGLFFQFEKEEYDSGTYDEFENNMIKIANDLSWNIDSDTESDNIESD